jgi:hypothetical protein
MTILDFRELGLPPHARDLPKIIHDIDPTVTLERLPNGHPYLVAQPDKPYALIHRPAGMPEYVIESFPESMLDERMISILFEWDVNRFGQSLDKFAAVDHARHVRLERARADELQEKNDKMAFMMKKRRME